MEKGENEYWEAFCQQSEPVTFISLFLDFHEQFEGAQRYQVQGSWGEVRWAQERKGLVMADGGRHGPNEV